MSRQGILDTEYRRGNGRLHIGTLKGQIRVDHLAVNQPQVFAVAQWLGADDSAVFKSDMLAVPGQVFAFYQIGRASCRERVFRAV